MHFFPPALSFLISQMFIILSQSSELSSREIRCLSCDMIMALFIGPAICEPEKHGIIADIPISTVARHNLNQVDEEICRERSRDGIFYHLDRDHSANISNVE